MLSGLDSLRDLSKAADSLPTGLHEAYVPLLLYSRFQLLIADDLTGMDALYSVSGANAHHPSSAKLSQRYPGSPSQNDHLRPMSYLMV